MTILILLIIITLLTLGVGFCFYLIIKLNRALKQSLIREQFAYKELLDFPAANPNPVMRVNKMGVLIYANPASAPLIAHWKINLKQKLPGEWREIIRQILQTNKSQTLEHNVDKQTYSITIVPVGQETISLFAMDVTSRKKAEKELERKATIDELTGLTNRTIFQQNVGLEINHAKTKQSKFAIYIVRLDDYNEIVNTYGQKIAERFIQLFAGRLTDLFSDLNTISRISENEFGVLAPDSSEPSNMASMATTIIEQCTTGYNIGEVEIFTTISIGIGFYPNDGQETENLIRNIQLAVNRTTSTRNQFEFFQRGMVDQLQIKRNMISDLYKAIEKKQFTLYYQPQIYLSSMQMKGAEALIRWEHPEQGFISPYFFMTAAEETQLILPIGEWVIRTACKQIVTWQKAGFPYLQIAINVSAQQLFHGNIVDQIRSIVREMGAQPHQIEIELTETALARDIPRAIEIMKRFRDSGFEIALDDFGTGYSSLSYLMQFPVNKIKIDRSFVKIIEENMKQNHALIRGIIDLGHNLNLKVVAEGVETKAQLKFLKENNCDIIQGYYFAQPQPANKFEAFFKTNWKK